ncbi:MAG: TlpA disulfide reductase family protein [Candidatus Tectomicrobia bacterium]
MRTSPLASLCIALLLALGVQTAQGAPARLSEQISLTSAIKETLKTLPHVQGPQISDTTFAHKVVVVTFFASWCYPCREEFAHLQKIHTQYHRLGVEIIAVNLFENFDNLSDHTRLMKYLHLTQPPFTIVKGNEVISRQFGTVTRIPTLFVFDKQGRRALQFVNEPDGRQPTIDLATLRQVIVTLL